MRIRPLTGQVLLEMMPESDKEGSLFLPEVTNPNSPEDIYRHKGAQRGKVVEIGPWPKAKNGYARLPEFGIGATVLVLYTVGVKLDWQTSGRLRLVRVDEVIAVVGG